MVHIPLTYVFFLNENDYVKTGMVVISGKWNNDYVFFLFFCIFSIFPGLKSVKNKVINKRIISRFVLYLV